LLTQDVIRIGGSRDPNVWRCPPLPRLARRRRGPLRSRGRV